MGQPSFTKEEWETCLKVLKTISRQPDEALDVEQFKGLVTKIYTRAKKERRSRARAEVREQNQTARESAQLFHQNKAIDNPLLLPSAASLPAKRLLAKPDRCYCCKEFYTEIHHFYHRLCPPCAELNYRKRFQTADLTGRKAVLTGGRMKIGFQTALRLLRDGAEVILTTRFPKSAAEKFSRETDFALWQNRLRIYGLDLRNLAAVEEFINYLLASEPHLDIIINNAAQTIKRPKEFYKRLLETENQIFNQLPEAEKSLLVESSISASANLLEIADGYPNLYENERRLIAVGSFDGHGQPFDYRATNSWTLKLDEVSTVEMVEAQLVNNIAPFMLNSRLKTLLLKSPHARKFIVNVSAMEGQFGRKSKTAFHPHTNMAKAALNMMTRTAAQDYARDFIYMNSVDTGWITEENPFPKKSRIQERGFVTPLDEIDGMARVYDPIARGINQAEEPVFGHFLKDYAPSAW